MRVTRDEIETVLSHYVDTLLWANSFEYNGDGELERAEHVRVSSASYPWHDPDATYLDTEDFALEDVEIMRGQIASFLGTISEDDGLEYVEMVDGWHEQMGHDFLLTRCGHGAGFWSRGLGDLGDRLTELAKPYGDTYALIEKGVPTLAEW